MDVLGSVGFSTSAVVTVLGSIINLLGNGHYLHWHFINISVANLVVICLMVIVFVLAIVLPFPGHRSKGNDDAQ